MTITGHLVGIWISVGAHLMHSINQEKLTFPTLQSLTGKYREIQGKPCNENREPAMRTGFPCNESRYFPVGIDLQGFPVSCTGFGFAVCSTSIPEARVYISLD